MVYALDTPRTVKAVPLDDICKSWLQPLEDKCAANENDQTKTSRVDDVFPTQLAPPQERPAKSLQQCGQRIQKIERPKLGGDRRGPIGDRAGVKPKLNDHRNHVLNI